MLPCGRAAGGRIASALFRMFTLVRPVQITTACVSLDLFIRHRLLGMRLPVQPNDEIEIFDGLRLLASITGETLTRVVTDTIARMAVMNAVAQDIETRRDLERIEEGRADFLIRKPLHPVPADRRAVLRKARKERKRP